MTRAARFLAAMVQNWSRRPSAPGAAWLPPERAWYRRFPHVMSLREGLDGLYTRGEVAWGWIVETDGAAWLEGDEASFGRVAWCDDPYGARFPEALSRMIGEFEQLRLHGSPAPGLRSVQVPDGYDRSVGIRRFPPLLARDRVVWHAPVVLYREQLPGGLLQGCRIPIVRARAGDIDRVSLLPEAFWPPELVVEWRAGEWE